MNRAPCPHPHHDIIEELYLQHRGMLLGRIRRYYKDPLEAEEVLHEVFMRAMDKLHTFRGDSAASTWMYQLTTRYCLNRLRDRRRRRELLEEHHQDRAWGQTSHPPLQEHRATLRDLARQLDAELVEIGIQAHVEGRTHKEISEGCGCSRRTIGNRLKQLEAQARQAVKRAA